ncbi:hypothetical protein IW140_003245 [Coemansia sp. RSA 1813]|nr:hypothetical protein EV178_002497 [Coemansia sp. RSA 1646]KAJ1771406.1 hypothetical protein LPJ74_002336 [Coemansia sp. RSA 1843]KAJ2089167.1 hypothetical protein IW138_003627 [Coemansia sp. RSA 986]KAJ2213774.1 hypothetical protein EV179_003576 [Coemansia sp. RSA 487]KAJ2569267.1 hypothetical protein IW140_003245 [Coemansia sp. RSA 1813]
MTSDSPSDSDNRLPSNAQRRETTNDSNGTDTNGPATSAVAQSIPRSRENPASLARATDRLASPPSSVPRSLYMDEVAANSSSAGDEDNGSDVGSFQQRAGKSLDKAAAVRRLKRHLVTRTGQNTAVATVPLVAEEGSTAAGEFHSLAREQQQAFGDVEDGYAGDVNDEEDDDRDSGGASKPSEAVVADPLKLLSGDITYGIYRWHRENDQSGSEVPSARRHQRRGSFSGMASDSDWGVPYSQQQMGIPGGFRRQFVHDRAVRQGRDPAANMLTENFIDFIGLYGHFAGGDYPSDEDEDDEEDSRAVDACTPLLHRQATGTSRRSIHATASNKKAFFLLLKAFVGTGVLVLPKAFSNGGLVASSAMMFFVAWYAWHCMVILGEVYLRVGGSYSDLAEKLFGRWASRTVTVSILFAQIGFCSAYTIFVATNMRDLWNAVTGCRFNFSPTFWVLAQLVAYIPLSWVRRIKQFAPFALAANIFIMLGLGYVLAYDIFNISSHGMAEIVQYNPARFPLFVGTAVFAYEGVTLVIPVIDSMKHQDQFAKVLTVALAICIVVFVGIGALSYMAFGESVETVILINLPKGPPTILVQLFYSLAIMMSVPLQLFPAVRILESGIFPHSGKGNPRIKWRKNVFRTLLTFVVASIAIFGAEQLDNFIAIIGAFSCTPLSFIFPTALHYQISAGHRWTRIKDVVLGIIGTIILIYVTYIGIMSWGAAAAPIDKCSANPP